MPEVAEIPGVADLWALTRGDPSVRLAMIDGPADLAHPCFAGANVTVVEPSWLPRGVEEAIDGAARARLEHGTWVASVLFGRPGSEVTGLAPGCQGLVIPSLRGDVAELEPVNLARSIECAVDEGASVVIVEICFASRSGDVDWVLKRSLHRAARAGVLVLAGAGNERGDCTCFPAASADVLAVGAHDDEDRVFAFSNWGREYEGHGLVAPGANINGALPGEGTVRHQGTSCSGPVAAGIAALLASLRVRRGVSPDPIGVGRALLRTAAPCSTGATDGEPRRCIDGRLDVPAATRLVLSDIRSASPERSEGRAPAAASGAVVSSSGRPGPSAVTGAGSLVYVLGVLGYDFGNDARRDAFERYMSAGDPGPADAYDEHRVLDHLRTYPADAAALTWTLSLENTPVYALAPVGPYAAGVHEQLARLFAGQLAAPGAPLLFERVAVPGRLTDRRFELESRETVPVVRVDGLRGLHGLNAAALADAAAAHVSRPGTSGDQLRGALREFLTRIYEDLSNLGATSPERALNYAATNAYQVADTFAAALAQKLVLDTVHTTRSAVCRIDSDCWDVVLRFFDPDNGRRSRRLFRFTIDVSDVVPVTLGEVKGWSESEVARVAA